MSHPRIIDVLTDVAERNGVCIRPIAIRRIDTSTGATEILEVPCGARLASKCKPCAERNRRLRIQQIREGWHLDSEPVVPVNPPDVDVVELMRERAQIEDDRAQAMRAGDRALVDRLERVAVDIETAIAATGVRGKLPRHDDDKPARAKRSTRRRQDTPDLPTMKVEKRTVGRTRQGKNGRTHRPSMLLTLTLGSYGPVHTAIRRGPHLMTCPCGQLHGQRDDILGTPLDPDSYDYRAAACDAIHFARVMDRFWQNLRRATGWNVQYAGAVELQKRLAPHAHFTIRGTIPRKLLREVAAATYHQVWWPPFDQLIYPPARPPTWDTDQAGYVDPRTDALLPTWGEAIDALDDEDAQPAYVARLGTIDPREMKGTEAGSRDAEHAIRYVTKYVTKDLTDHARVHGDAPVAHRDRLQAELALLPCSPTCANWLLYGVQPDGAGPDLVAGQCTGKVHQRETLGFTGRRVLISRQWSGKTLSDHRADNRAWVRAALASQAADEADTDRPAPRYVYELTRPGARDVPPLQHRLLRAIAIRIQWRAQLARARERDRDRDREPVSATQDPKSSQVAA
jgi:hypothetical protein